MEQGWKFFRFERDVIEIYKIFYRHLLVTLDLVKILDTSHCEEYFNIQKRDLQRINTSEPLCSYLIRVRFESNMISVLRSGLARELQAILTLYLGTLLGGYSMGFSAVAIPDIKTEMR